MFSSLATFRHDLAALVEAAVPTSWRIVPNLQGAVNAVVPVVYFEFAAFDTSDAGGNLERGVVSATCDLIVVEPSTNDKTETTAEDLVDEHVIRLLAAVDPRDDMYWTDAKKERLSTGSLAWRVPVRALVALELPPEPAPAPVDPEPTPDPIEEYSNA